MIVWISLGMLLLDLVFFLFGDNCIIGARVFICLTAHVRVHLDPVTTAPVSGQTRGILISELLLLWLELLVNVQYSICAVSPFVLTIVSKNWFLIVIPCPEPHILRLNSYSGTCVKIYHNKQVREPVVYLGMVWSKHYPATEAVAHVDGSCTATEANHIGKCSPQCHYENLGSRSHIFCQELEKLNNCQIRMCS